MRSPLATFTCVIGLLGLSAAHASAMIPETTQVPDTAVTFSLFGLALLGLVCFRRFTDKS
jgi:hypothetical protein